MTDRPAIKPLEWAEQLGISYAETPFGVYKVADHGAWWFDDGPIKGNLGRQQAQSDFEARIRSCLIDKPEAVEGEDDAPIEAAEAGWNACRRQVYLLSEDYIERTHPLKGTDTVEGNFYRGQYDVAKSFAKAFSAFEARDCDYFKQIDFAALSTRELSEARRKAFEEAAELIEANIVKDSSAGKFLAPRQEGNRDGLHYAAAIRQLAEEEAR